MYAYIAEFLGTFLLVATIAFIGNAWAIGLSLAIGILAVGAVSGGHFNPAVSFWAWTSGTLSGGNLAVYVASQLAAAATVAGLKRMMMVNTPPM